MGRKMLLLAAVTLLASCYPYRWSTNLQPGDTPGTYRFQAIAMDWDHPKDDASAEADRRKLLDEGMRKNNFCPSGYTVGNGQAVYGGKGLIGEAWTITYIVRCKT